MVSCFETKKRLGEGWLETWKIRCQVAAKRDRVMVGLVKSWVMVGGKDPKMWVAA